MIYVTGDTHCDFKRFTKKERMKMQFEIKPSDYIIICGDFGLLWAKDKEFQYNLEWLSGLPFTILWVQGNHENYNMIEEYQLEEWNGGKVRHIARDKIILLERGQVFNIEGNRFFTFGGASSHDISGGILDRKSSDFTEQKKKIHKSGLNYRIRNESWWEQELPSEDELMEGLINLSKVNYKVDFVISHCMANRMQTKLVQCITGGHSSLLMPQDVLTDYFEMLEDKLIFKHWFCGHYHEPMELDNKHTILYKNIVRLKDYS